MQLIEFGYKEMGWTFHSVKGIPLTNLIVGKNSAGKSKFLHSLFIVTSFLRNILDISNAHFESNMLFKDNEDNEIFFAFSVENGQVIEEKLLYNGDIKITRDRTQSEIEGEPIKPPLNRLVLHVRRDVDRYPYLENIIGWSEQVCYLRFNEIELHPGNNTAILFNNNKYAAYSMIKSLKDNWRERIIEQAKQLDYKITGIDAVPISNEEQMVIAENGVNVPLLRSNMSRGMYRVLYILIFMEYSKQHGLPSALLIDDFCEGLDFERAKIFGQILFDFCEENHIQLFTTSNDRFLMNTININNWIILYRKQSEVENINKASHPHIFEKFSFTGLSNFDLFSSDFIEKQINNE